MARYSTHPENIDWDAERMIDAAGGARALGQLLAKHGFDPPSVELVHTWRSRNRVPHRWVPACLYVLLKERRGALGEFLTMVSDQ